jgi:hypothetical protein
MGRFRGVSIQSAVEQFPALAAHHVTLGNRSPTDRGATGPPDMQRWERPKDPEARGCTAHPKLSNGTLNPPPPRSIAPLYLISVMV